MDRAKKSDLRTTKLPERAGVALYARATSPAGLAAQLWALRQYAREHRLPVGATFTDVGRSVKGLDVLIAALEERRFVMVLVRTFESFTVVSAPHALRILSLAESLDIGIISILGSLDLRSRIARLVAYTGILVAARVAVLRATRRASRRPAARHPRVVRTRHVQR